VKCFLLGEDLLRITQSALLFLKGYKILLYTFVEFQRVNFSSGCCISRFAQTHTHTSPSCHLAFFIVLRRRFALEEESFIWTKSFRISASVCREGRRRKRNVKFCHQVSRVYSCSLTELPPNEMRRRSRRRPFFANKFLHPILWETCVNERKRMMTREVSKFLRKYIYRVVHTRWHVSTHIYLFAASPPLT